MPPALGRFPKSTAKALKSKILLIKRMKFIIDNKIPFIKGRLEPLGETIYAAPAEITPASVKDADALIVRTRTICGPGLLQGSSAKLIATATIGTDHIDLEWCRNNGIAVANAAGCNAPGVAQYVWASLLENGFDTSRHTLGVVGYGNIGTIVADWGRKLGARVIICDPPRKKSGLTDEEYLPLETILCEADAVTLHTPLTRSGDDATFHLIGERQLAMMKPGSILVNAARGPVADNRAWAAHLKANNAKAIIDVWENEPEISTPLLELASVATPHIAGYSLEGKQRATRMALEAIEKHFGVKIDTSGLEGTYTPPAEISGPSQITSSYNPAADTALLRANPQNFEKLRSDYNYRPEPSFL